MKMVNITLKDESDPKSCIHEIKDKNGTERTEFDLVLTVASKPVEIKVKMYHTTSSLDVQGRSPDYKKIFKEYGDRTLAVHFVENLLENIKEEVNKQLNLNEINNFYKEQAELGYANEMNLTKKSNLKSKSNTRVSKYKLGIAYRALKSKTSNLSRIDLHKVVLKINNKEDQLKIDMVPSIPCDSCVLKFPTLDTVNVHKLNSHGGILKSCDQCDFKTVDGNQMEIHVKAHMKSLYSCDK